MMQTRERERKQRGVPGSNSHYTPVMQLPLIFA
jgi:hypothetical protein